jgi:hypothetical protein
MAALLLSSCSNGQFLGLTKAQWGNVAVSTGKELGKQLPGAAVQAYKAERLRPLTAAKQPSPVVNPAEADRAVLLLPENGGNAIPPSGAGWLSGILNLFN